MNTYICKLKQSFLLFATQSFTNSVQRANQTCQIILDENTNSPNINAENVVKEKLLKERNFGVLEGESYDIIPSIIGALHVL